MRCFTFIALLLLGSGCAGLAPSKGGGQTAPTDARRVDPAHVALPAGYRAEVVATGLNMPSGVTFDAQNRPVVVEAGYSYGEAFATPRLLRIDPDGRTTVIATGDKQFAPWNGVVFHDRAFYVAEGGVLGGGRISRIDEVGKVTPLIANLPSRGDHHTNGPAIGPDGNVYFAVGVATNSGVVGIDNYRFGWLKRASDFHDIPARDIRLTGQNFNTDNPLTPDKNDKATTGAYVPFSMATRPGQVIEGALPCTGGIMRIGTKSGELSLVGWGLRNPFGLAFAPDGRLLVSENQYDDRGSRPVWGSGDLLWAIDPRQEPLWYGWPDFHGDHPLTWDDHYQPPGKPAPKFLLAEHPNKPPKPLTRLGVHGAACGLDVSRSESFGHAGEAFVALFGDMAPSAGKVMEPVGFQVARVDLVTGVIEPFAVNRGKKNGPASKLKTGGLERPVACRFDPSGDALYVVDFGILTMDKQGPKPRENTGVLWRIVRGGEPAQGRQR
jgi:glucose/arabinose dehydrogenase